MKRIFLNVAKAVDRCTVSQYAQTEAERQVYRTSQHQLRCKFCKYSCMLPALAILQYPVEMCCAACAAADPHERLPVDWMDCMLTAFWNFEVEHRYSVVHMRREMHPYMEKHWAELFHPHREKIEQWAQSVVALFSAHHNVFESVPGRIPTENRWRLRRAGPPPPLPLHLTGKRPGPAPVVPALIKQARLEPETFESVTAKIARALAGRDLVDWRTRSFCIEVRNGCDHNLVGSAGAVAGSLLKEWQYHVLAALSYHIVVPLNNFDERHSVLARMVLDWFASPASFPDRDGQPDCFCPKDAFGALLKHAEAPSHTESYSVVRAYLGPTYSQRTEW